MAVKTFILLALLILPSIINAQSNKEAFSIELKLDKTNFAFGEDVDVIITIKNISEKRDSLTWDEFYNIFGCNVTLVHNSDKTSFCVCVMATMDSIKYKIFQSGESYSTQLPASGICGNISPGEYAIVNLLNTGSYTIETYCAKVINRGTNKEYSKRIKSNKINFYVNPPDENNKKIYKELQNIVGYTLEEKRDSVYMLPVAQKLDEFIRKNISTYSADIAYSILRLIAINIYSLRNDYVKLSEFYLMNKPNGSQVFSALFRIYDYTYRGTKNKFDGIAKIEEYVILYPGTEIEREGKRLIEFAKQSEDKIY